MRTASGGVRYNDGAYVAEAARSHPNLELLLEPNDRSAPVNSRAATPSSVRQSSPNGPIAKLDSSVRLWPDRADESL
jgi:hypothetical protein